MRNMLSCKPAAIVIILLAVCLVYLNSFPGAFHYDDFGLFLENPELRDQVGQPLSLVKLVAGRPLSILSLELNLYLGGEDPFWFHLVNLVLHLAVTSLLFFLVARLSGSNGIALLTALLFALHPLQAQTVNYIWARSLLLMSLFLLLAISAAAAGKKKWLTLILFQLAIWSRMDALAALPVLFFLQRRGGKPILILGAFNLAAAACSLVSADNPDMAWNHGTPARYLFDAPLNLFRYLKLMFNPGGHSIFHAVPEPEIMKTSISIFLIAIIVIAVIKIRRVQPLLFAGTAWLILMLLPSLVIPNADPVNESRAYLAFAGAALFTAVLLKYSGKAAGEKLAHLAGRPLQGKISVLTAFALPIACVVLLSLMTINRNSIWNDDIKIWEEAVSINPETHLPAYNLGIALVRGGEIRRGCEVLARAIELNPLDDLSYSSSGYCYELLGETNTAIVYYSRALEINPENTAALESLENLGIAWIRQ